MKTKQTTPRNRSPHFSSHICSPICQQATNSKDGDHLGECHVLSRFKLQTSCFQAFPSLVHLSRNFFLLLLIPIYLPPSRPMALSLYSCSRQPRKYQDFTENGSLTSATSSCIKSCHLYNAERYRAVQEGSAQQALQPCNYSVLL